MEPTTEMIEAAARALAQDAANRNDMMTYPNWESMPHSFAEMYRAKARAALSAALAAAPSVDDADKWVAEWRKTVRNADSATFEGYWDKYVASLESIGDELANRLAAAPTQDEGGVRIALDRVREMYQNNDITDYETYVEIHEMIEEVAALAAPASEAGLAAKIREILDRDEADYDAALEYKNPETRREGLADRALMRIQKLVDEYPAAPASAEPSWELRPESRPDQRIDVRLNDAAVMTISAGGSVRVNFVKDHLVPAEPECGKPWCENPRADHRIHFRNGLPEPSEDELEQTARVVTRGLDTDCARGFCIGKCSHLMWACEKCSFEGGWGSPRDVLEKLAAEHVCPSNPAPVSRDAELIAEAKRFLSFRSFKHPEHGLIRRLVEAYEEATK